MSENFVIASSQHYAMHLFEKWRELYNASEEYSLVKLRGGKNREMIDIQYFFAVKLCRYWKELIPLMKNRNLDKEPHLKELNDRFWGFQDIVKNPRILLEKENEKKIYDLEVLIREIIDVVGVTRFDYG